MDKETFVRLLNSGKTETTENRVNWSDVLSELANRDTPFTVKDVHILIKGKRDDFGIRMKLNAWVEKGYLLKVKLDGRVTYMHRDQIQPPEAPEEPETETVE